MDRLRSDDPASLQLLLDEYGDALRREIRFTLLDARLRQFVGDSDVYQSVVVRFFVGMKDGDFEVRTPDDLMRLLKGIARKRVAELVRYWHARKRDLNRNGEIGRDIIDQLATADLPPPDALERSELLANVNGRLSARDRNILQWQSDGRSWSQIAELLRERSAETVRKRHERALAKIRRLFGDEPDAR